MIFASSPLLCYLVSDWCWYSLEKTTMVEVVFFVRENSGTGAGWSLCVIIRGGDGGGVRRDVG